VHPPAFQPAEVTQPVRGIALDTETDISERDEETRDGGVESEVDDRLRGRRQLSRHPVDAESAAKDGKVERGVVMVDVGDTCHDCKALVNLFFWEQIQHLTYSRMEGNATTIR